MEDAMFAPVMMVLVALFTGWCVWNGILQLTGNEVAALYFATPSGLLAGTILGTLMSIRDAIIDTTRN
jgi:hypothetical protein